MRLGYSALQLRAAEARHLALGEPLMQLAAAGLAEVLRSLLADRPGSVLLLVGTGDNGGDALFAGAHLAAEGVEVLITPTGERMHAEGLEAALAAGATLTDVATVAARAVDAAIVVDGIVGTGTSPDPALRGRARQIVANVLPVLTASTRPLVVAVDIPSGIDPNDGSVPDDTVLPADVTVTFGGYKAGLLLHPASALAGDVRLVDIGLGPDLAYYQPVVRVAD